MKHYWTGTKNGIFGRHEFKGKINYSCGHRRNHPGHQDINLSRPCYDCCQAMIGTVQTVVRYGNLPKSGKSYNYADNVAEIGISCYLVGTTPRPEFTDRKKLVFKALVVSFGSDDEPIIDMTTIIETQP